MDLLDELGITAAFFMLFGILIAATTNAGLAGPGISLGLFVLLVLPGYFYSKTMGFKGAFAIGISIMISMTTLVVVLYAINLLTGIRMMLPLTLITIALMTSVGYYLYKNNSAQQKPKKPK
jgi:hypothetical protein